VHALAGERIQVHRQGPDQGLALAGAHFGDLAVVQDHAADQLDVVVAHAEHALRGLAHHRESLRQQGVEAFALLDARLELRRLGLQLGIAELLHLRFKRVDLLLDLLVALEQAFVTTAEQAGQDLIEHGLNA